MLGVIPVYVFALYTVAAQSSALYPFATHGKYGFKDEHGSVRVPATFDGAEPFAEGLAAVAMISGEEPAGRAYGARCFVKARKWGFIDPSGRVVIAPQFSEVRRFVGGKAVVRVGEKWGFIDHSGQRVIKPKFADVHDFSEGLASATNDGHKWGFIDEAGRWVVEPQFVEVGDFTHGLAKVRPADNARSGYIDRSGRSVIPATYIDRNLGHSENAILVEEESYQSYLLFARDGRLVSQKKELRLLGEGLVAYRDSARGPLGLMDEAGAVIAMPIYDEVSTFSESLAAVKKGGRWSFINRAGVVVIPLDADYADGFHEGLAAVSIAGYTGYLDRTGRMVIPPSFATGGPFSSGLASVCFNTDSASIRPYERPDLRCGFIDTAGAFVIRPRFSNARPFEGGLAEVGDPVLGNRLLVNRSGKIVDRPDWAQEFQVQPYGRCQQPAPAAPAPAPPDYRATFGLNSNPPGASAYLIPLWDWESNQDGTQLLSDRAALETYLLTQGSTPLTGIRVKAQVYMVVVELMGRRKVMRISVTRDGPQTFSAVF